MQLNSSSPSLPQSKLQSLRAAAPILIGVSVMLSLSMGLRQSLGLFVQPAVQELSLAVADFTLAIAVQNLVWGFLQPLAGLWAARYGFRIVMTAGAALYALGLLVLATATGYFGVMLGAGLLIGPALACIGSGIAMAVASRPVPLAVRSTVLGLVSAAGSIGAAIAAPIGQGLIAGFGWRTGVFGFVALALIIIPAAWVAGRVDKAAIPPEASHRGDAIAAGPAFRSAFRNGPFMIMAVAYFVCGLQLVFLTTHLPSYLAICGMDPMLGAKALATIGVFNVLGSLFFGWAGGRWSKPMLLGLIYILRSLMLAWYFATLPTPDSTILFAAVMGFLWLGVAPLVAGAVAEMFGLRWLAMIGGIAFMSHQLGSAVGAFGGGLLFDLMGSYSLAVQIGAGMGLTAGVLQVLAGLPRWPGARRAAH
ncbi:MAG: MFS transporter [Betaproteobacteria bacterium]|nr:MFS transporter [Betaproteobacteria bacterium]